MTDEHKRMEKYFGVNMINDKEEIPVKRNKTKLIEQDGEHYQVTMLDTLEQEVTERGFGLWKFEDAYMKKCSLQDSSLATEPAIWFGINNAEPKRLEKGKGWVPFIIPDDVHLTTRMHLTREQVKALLPILTYFAETGEYVRDYKESENE